MSVIMELALPYLLWVGQVLLQPHLREACTLSIVPEVTCGRLPLESYLPPNLRQRAGQAAGTQGLAPGGQAELHALLLSLVNCVVVCQG